MKVTPRDLWTLCVEIDDLPFADGPGRAILTATQPNGYKQRFEQDVEIRDGAASFDLLYPLVDDGDWSGPREVWVNRHPFNWPTGSYVFTVRIVGAGAGPVSSLATIEVDDLYTPLPGKPRLCNTPQQFLQCAFKLFACRGIFLTDSFFFLVVSSGFKFSQHIGVIISG